MKTAAGSTGTGRRHSLHRCRHVGRRPVRLAAVFVVLVVIATTAAVDDDVSPGHTAVVAPTVAAAADDVQRQRWPQEHYCSCPRISRTAACLFGHRRPRPPTGLDECHVHHSLYHCGKVKTAYYL